MAKSSASSMPCSRTATSSRRKSSRSPSSGWIASWPPSSLPIAYGLPGSPASARKGIVAALAMGAADGVDRREIENVEAHRGDLRQAPDHVVEGTVACRVAAFRARNSSYQLAKRASGRSTSTGYSRLRTRCSRGPTRRNSSPVCAASHSATRPRRSGRPAGVRPAAHRRRRSPDRRARRSAAAVRRPRAAPGPAAGVRHAWHAISRR